MSIQFRREQKKKCSIGILDNDGDRLAVEGDCFLHQYHTNYKSIIARRGIRYARDKRNLLLFQALCRVYA